VESVEASCGPAHFANGKVKVILAFAPLRSEPGATSL
jgi:hypothetical protein